MQNTADHSIRVGQARRDWTWARARRLAGTASAYGAVLLLCAFVLLPLGWMLTAALKPDKLPVFTIPPQWFPTEHWNWENFGRTLLDERRPFLAYTTNTLQIVLGNIVGTLFSCSLVGYAFARLRFRGRRVVLGAMLVYMQVEAYILTPRVMSKAVQVPGSIVLIAALAGGTLAGLPGALVAIPVAAGILLIIKEVVVPAKARS